MKIKEPIRKKASTILGIYIQDGGWDEAFSTLNREGKPTTAQLNTLIRALLKELEGFEVFIEDIYLHLEQHNAKPASNRSVTDDAQRDPNKPLQPNKGRFPDKKSRRAKPTA